MTLQSGAWKFKILAVLSGSVYSGYNAVAAGFGVVFPMILNLDDAYFAATPAPIRADGTHAPVSYWHETVAFTPTPPLKEDTAADVVIVGGGFSGLSTAIELKREHPALDVVLLERGVCGHGASGRNGGFAMPLIGWDLSDAARQLGKEQARNAYRMMYKAVAHLKRMVKDHGIDCDLEETGYLLLATCEARRRRLIHEDRLAQELGFDITWLEGDALRQHIRAERFLGGLYDPSPCVVNPAKLTRGLADMAVSLGVRVYEQTPLQRLEVREDGVKAQTTGGMAAGKLGVLAVNGYGNSLGFMANQVLPVHTFIVLTEPLSNAQLEDIGWGGKRTSLETARNMIHYFRLTADNRILFGGEDVELYYGGRYEDAHEGIFQALTERFREYFPSLSQTAITHKWGGQLGVTMDMFPSFGETGPGNTLFHATGYSGHGVSLSNYAGRILAPRILKRLGHKPIPHDEPFFYNRQPMRLPPDPVRYFGMRAYRKLLRAQDRLQRA